MLSNDTTARNVFLVGNTGSGKSTLGNFLCKLGNDSVPSPFLTGDGAEPVTRDVSVQPWPIYERDGKSVKCTIMLHDTPGLNEGAAEDPSYMSSILSVLSKVEYVSCVILCLPDFRMDRYLLRTLRYYSELFEPVFKRGNVVILRTRFDPDEYEAASYRSGGLEEEKQRLLETIQEKLPLYANVSYVDFINSKFINHRWEDNLVHLWEKIDSCIPFATDCIYTHSLVVRSNLMHYVNQCVPVKMNHFIPLPPALESQRLARLKWWKKYEATEIEKTRKFSEENARTLEDWFTKVKNLDELENKARMLFLAKRDLEMPIILSKVTLSGRSIDQRVTLKADEPFHVPSVWNFYNCKPEIIHRTLNSVEIKLDLSHLGLNGWNNTQSWFAELWLEQDGKIINASAISKKEVEIAAIRETIAEKRRGLEEEVLSGALGVDAEFSETFVKIGGIHQTMQVLRECRFSSATLPKLMTSLFTLLENKR